MKTPTRESLIQFENHIKTLWESGDLPFLLHLCGGNENQLIDIFSTIPRRNSNHVGIQPGDWVFSGHRSHYHYLCAGGDPDELENMIRNGDSMFVFGAVGRASLPAGAPSSIGGLEARPTIDDDALQVNFLTSSVLAGTCGIAAGVALAIKQKAETEDSDSQPSPLTPPHVWCFLGDGAEDEGHFYEAVRFVEGFNLPCTFIVEDNNRSVDTDVTTRRGTVVVNQTIWSNFSCVKRYHYVPTYPHAGSGCKHKIEFKPWKKV